MPGTVDSWASSGGIPAIGHDQAALRSPDPTAGGGYQAGDSAVMSGGNVDLVSRVFYDRIPREEIKKALVQASYMLVDQSSPHVCFSLGDVNRVAIDHLRSMVTASMSNQSLARSDAAYTPAMRAPQKTWPRVNDMVRQGRFQGSFPGRQ